MGLTCQSCGRSVLNEKFNIRVSKKDELVIALAGNPNVGKSTVFNALTGLNQHTGNWPGKTVTNAQGNYLHRDKKFVLVDLPGTYSLLSNSLEEVVARDFLCFGKPDATIVVLDATCLERNLNLALQVLELTGKVVLCINLMDEAKRKGILIDIEGLENELGVPVVATIARKGIGLDLLMEKVYNTASKIKSNTINTLKYPPEIEFQISAIQEKIETITKGSINARWVALRILEGDTSIIESIQSHFLEENIELLNKEGACIYEC